MRVFGEILVMILSVPVMILGCLSGYMFEAFMAGVRQGRSDYHLREESEKPTQRAQ